ncbi:unnamed protein product, partial [Rotaria magnacalcarata]
LATELTIINPDLIVPIPPPSAFSYQPMDSSDNWYFSDTPDTRTKYRGKGLLTKTKFDVEPTTTLTLTEAVQQTLASPNRRGRGLVHQMLHENLNVIPLPRVTIEPPYFPSLDHSPWNTSDEEED